MNSPSASKDKPSEKQHPTVIELLIALFVLCAAVLGFILLADAVSSGVTEQFDQRILLALRSPDDLSDPIGSVVVESVVRDITALGGVALMTLTTLAVVGFLGFSGQKTLAVWVLIASVGALLLSSGLKQMIDRPRPDLVPHQTMVHTQSFPSGHATQSAATYLTLGVLLAGSQRRRRVKVFIFTLAVLTTVAVGFSRIYLGVHWPTDVLAGWTAGAAWALCCWGGARYMMRTSTRKMSL